MKLNIFFQDSSICRSYHINSAQFKSEWKSKELAALIHYYSGKFEIKEHIKNVEVSIKNIEHRYDGDESKKDIHEKDRTYLQTCYNSAINACKELNFIKIKCVENGKMLSIDSINDQIFDTVKKMI